MKKLISTLLTIAMLLSLIPAVFAEDVTLEKSGVKIVYDLSKVIVDNKLEYSTGSDSIAEIDYEMTNGFFDLVFATHEKAKSGQYYMYKRDNVGAFLAMSSSTTVSFEVFVPKAGVYDLEMYAPKTNYVNKTANPPTSAKGTVMNVYVSKNGKSTATGDLKGAYNTWEEYEGDTYVAVSEPKIVENIEFPEAGKYTITFKPTCGNYNYQTVGTFALNGGDNLVPMMSSVTADKSEIYVADTAQITAIAEYMSDAENLAEEVTYTYASSDEKVATVDGEGKVIGVGMGTATITATATKGGYSSSGSVDITVKSVNASGVTAVYDMIKGARDSAFVWNSEPSYLRNINYDSTNGFWRYHSIAEKATLEYHKINNAYGIYITGTYDWVAIAINVPKAGDYNVKFTHGMASGGASKGAMWILPGDTENITSAIANTDPILSDICYYQPSSAGISTKTRNAGTHSFAQGEHIVVYKISIGNSAMYPGKIELLGGSGAAYAGFVSAEDTVIEENGTTKVTARLHKSDDWTKITDYTFTSSNEDVATVEADGTVTAHKPGTATISATCSDSSVGNVIGTEITVNTPEYAAAFNPDDTGSETVNEVVNPLVYAKDGTKLDITPSATENADGTWLVSTVAESGEYKFLYWAKGLSTGIKKRIVSRSASFSYDAENEGNYLIAVYEKEGMKTSGEEYYNANGQLLENGDTLPYLAGYNGAATGWGKRGDGMHVAIFPEENRATYTITVDGTAKDYYYGETVTCTADAEKDGKKFFGWKKTVNGAPAELVSASTSYTFKAWETCEVTAVYENEAPVFSGVARKIVLGTFNVGNETAIMAEFIGFSSDVVERGISLDGTEIAMTTKEYNQFTIINNDNLPNISGYAILADGTKLVYNLNK